MTLIKTNPVFFQGEEAEERKELLRIKLEGGTNIIVKQKKRKALRTADVLAAKEAKKTAKENNKAKIKKPKVVTERKRPVKSNNRKDFDRAAWIISQEWGISIEELNSPSRAREFVVPRQILMYLTKDVCTRKYAAKRIGGRDHSTAINAIATIGNLIDTDKEFKRKVDIISLKISSQDYVVPEFIHSQHMHDNYEYLRQVMNQL
jgi:hypothetical protein